MTITIRPGIKLGPGVTVKVPVAPTIVTSGLVLHYDFSNPACYTSGTTITDLSTATNNGTLANDYSYISYVNNGQTSYFNWSSNSGGDSYNSFGSCINTTSTNTYKDFTIVFEPDFTMNGMAGLFSGGGDKSVRVYNNGWAFPNPGNNDDWDTTGGTTFYINGQTSNQAVPGWNIMGGATTNSYFNNNTLLHVGTSGYANRHMQGKIALVLMYNRVLTEQEQLQNYNVLKSRFGLA